MNKTVSYFDDIFMKMERKSLSLLGCQQPNKILLVMFSSCKTSKMQTYPVSSLLNTKYILVMVIGDIVSATSDVNGLKEMFAFWQFCIGK